jgi:phosphatidylserine/phosphatidylglycerophosphate/cardiolipin synthase-like enzyme
VSIPTRLKQEWKDYAERRDVDRGVSLEDALSKVFDTADNKLRVVAPYFELDGLERLEDAFEEAVTSGVNIDVLTRELIGPADDYSHNSDRKAILELIDRFEAISPSESSLTVYDYHHQIGGRKPKLDRSIHAKMAIADDKLAYVGSGEIRNSSMILNGEAGYLSRGQSDIETWIAFFDFFVDKAEVVTREMLEEVVEK